MHYLGPTRSFISLFESKWYLLSTRICRILNSLVNITPYLFKLRVKIFYPLIKHSLFQTQTTQVTAYWDWINWVIQGKPDDINYKNIGDNPNDQKDFCTFED